MHRTETIAEGVTLHLGDCREILPTLERADLVLTDPPYGIGQDGGRGHRLRAKAKVQEKLCWDKSRPERDLFELFQSVTTRNPSIRVKHKPLISLRLVSECDGEKKRGTV